MVVHTPRPACPELIASLTGVLDRIGHVPGVRIVVRDGNGHFAAVMDSLEAAATAGAGAECETFVLPLEAGKEEGTAVQLTFRSVTPECRRLFIELTQCLLDASEGTRREEALLDELGANWENLENLYELTAEIQGSHNTSEMFERLLARLTSGHAELRAGLFVEEAGHLIPVAARNAELAPLTWHQMPALAKMVHARRVALVDPSLGFADNLGWSNARALAIAPVATRNAVLGFLVVWRETESSSFDSSQLRLLEAIAYQAAVTVERDRLVRAVRESERLQRELEIAGSIHQLLLVSKPPKVAPQLEVAGFNLPSQKVDGDFHDYLMFPDGTLDVLVGDVMGKGVSAALVGAATKNNFLKAIAQLSLETPAGKPDVSQIVTMAAAGMHDSLVALERFVTVCYSRFDVQRRLLQFVDCGHTGIMLNRKRTGELLMLRGASLPLGVDRDEQYGQMEYLLLPGDNFLLYSDGVTEARNKEGELFGEERLSECLQTWSSLPADDVIRRIHDEVRRFIGEEPLSDDFTCLVVKMKSSRNREVDARSEEFAAELAALESARDWLSNSARDIAPALLDEDALDGLTLSLSEIFTNCVLHGGATMPIRISTERFSDRLRVTVHYRGRGFNISSVSLPSFDGTRDGGFGIYIVSHCADEFVHNQFNDGQCAISFTKYFRGNQ
jgi:sigma-B regulation protein RsbU (phosphoserine phosphatase)